MSNGIVCRFCFGSNCCKFDLLLELLLFEERLVVDFVDTPPCLITPPEVREVVLVGIVNDVQLDIVPPRRQHVSRSFMISSFCKQLLKTVKVKGGILKL